ncbi:type II and III secretion system protein family protein [Occallatibacter riparius]|uniref:Pilus assembly protein N-terminal domain-containing protein n=1 Tax=Occallatibacter riparius TaxID=1002689 RepID=A0A9J7BJS7_9BACT|nr:pilus assembly protein N-terminal domain-containing protein [Occallatibacter riparius]UWZ83080.1 pilus assembly protein N-terminal domain-containing protein [Occallatibacter riparius]
MKTQTHLSGKLVGLLLVAFSASVFGATPKSGSQGATSRQDATNDLALVVGRSVLLDTAQPVQRVAVGLGDFAEASVITPTEIMVNGKAPGETTLILWESGGNREFFNVVVRPSTAASVDKLEGVRRELRSELPNQNIKVTQEGNSVFLRGTVDNLVSSDRAEKIAATGGKVVNLLNVQIPTSRPQILLKCNFAAVDRSKTKELGINIFSTGLGNVIGAITTGQFSPPGVSFNNSGSGGSGGTSTATIGNDLNLFAFFPGLDLGATIKALEDKGIVQVLSEPNVLAEDGKQGSILAGGQYPYPVAQSSGTGGGSAISITFKEYGVRLIFLPHITAQGTIDLQVISEVSSLDFANAVTLSGFTVPAIAQRRVQTSVELAKGQSFAIGGLLDNRTQETLLKIPFISNIPILGKFFQSISKTKTNSELIVIVTPEIVQPASEGTIPNPKFPLPYLEPNSNSPMHHPDGTGTGIATAAPSAQVPVSMPVEQLIQSMKGTPTISDPGGINGSGGGEMGGGSGAGSTPQMAPPQQ